MQTTIPKSPFSAPATDIRILWCWVQALSRLRNHLDDDDLEILLAAQERLLARRQPPPIGGLR